MSFVWCLFRLLSHFRFKKTLSATKNGLHLHPFASGFKCQFWFFVLMGNELGGKALTVREVSFPCPFPIIQFWQPFYRDLLFLENSYENIRSIKTKMGVWNGTIINIMNKCIYIYIYIWIYVMQIYRVYRHKVSKVSMNDADRNPVK